MTSAFHPQLGEVNYSTMQLSNDPDTQVIQTVSVMRQFVCIDSETQEVKEDALEALRLGGGDPLLGVFHYTKQSITFVQDVDALKPIRPNKADDIEALIRPVDISLMKRRGIKPIGDCDDFSMYCSCLLRVLGIDSSFRVVAADPEVPNQYSHIYVVAHCNGQDVPMDCSHGESLGWEAPNSFGKQQTYLVNRSSFNFSGFNMWGWIAFAAGVGFWIGKDSVVEWASEWWDWLRDFE